MANIRPVDIVNMFNTQVKNRANSGISWGSNSKPANGGYGAIQNIYNDVFRGHTSGVNATVSTSGFSGNVRFSAINTAVLAAAVKFTVIRKVSVNMRYKYNEAVIHHRSGGRGGGSRSSSKGPDKYRNIYNGVKYGHLKSSYQATRVNDPSGAVAGLKNGAISRSAVETYMDKVWASVSTIRETTVSVHHVVCHTSCHNSCHSQCHGDGPGGGGR